MEIVLLFATAAAVPFTAQISLNLAHLCTLLWCLDQDSFCICNCYIVEQSDLPLSVKTSARTEFTPPPPYLDCYLCISQASAANYQSF